jgi:hypothetical protein
LQSYRGQNSEVDVRTKLPSAANQGAVGMLKATKAKQGYCESLPVFSAARAIPDLATLILSA